MLPIRVLDHYDLGTVKVPCTGLGDSFWQPVRSYVAEKQNVISSNVVILSVEVRGGGSISPDSASNMTVPDLVAQRPVVIVKLPEGSPPAWEHSVIELRQDVNQLQHDSRQIQKSMARLQRRIDAIALRALLDSVRTKVNGGVPLQDAEKLAWNARVANMPATELERLGLTAKQLGLTTYGLNTLQYQGTKATHEVDIQEVAEAVTTCSDEHRALFAFVYGEKPEGYVFPYTA